MENKYEGQGRMLLRRWRDRQGPWIMVARSREYGDVYAGVVTSWECFPDVALELLRLIQPSLFMIDRNGDCEDKSVLLDIIESNNTAAAWGVIDLQDDFVIDIVRSLTSPK